jgi:hypothetical protein
MPDFVTHVLRFPLFPFVIVALIAILYWRGFLTARQNKKNPVTQAKSDKR